jgi:hypothetical protein
MTASSEAHVSAGLIRKSRNWDYATTVLRREGSRIEKQVAGKIGGPVMKCSAIGLFGISAMDGRRW